MTHTPRHPASRRRRCAARPGTTLVEAVIATMIIAIAVVAVASALLAGTQQAYAAVDTSLAMDLADGMMEEILALPYADPEGMLTIGPDAGETTRLLFDNMDDYHGLSEAAGAVTDAQGTVYPAEYARLSRSVTITATTIQPAGYSTPVAALAITVTVSEGARTMAVLSQTVPEPPP